MSSPGLLHHLSQEITTESGESVTWLVFSSHFVAAPPRFNDRSSVSRSLTPSPHKEKKRSPPRLQSWHVRVCQIISPSADSKDAKAGGNLDSDTESDEEEKVTKALTTTWYSTQYSAAEASKLTKAAGEASWQTTELRIRVAWDKGCMDVLVDADDKRADGTYTSVKLAFDSEEGEEGSSSDKKAVEILLHRVPDHLQLQTASTVTAELTRAFGTLKNRTQSLVEERDHHRRLLQNNRRHERFREAGSSLVNPGRLKRKLQDDEGFEGDEEKDQDGT